MREPKAERAMQRPSTLAALYDTRATCGSCAHFEATNRLMGWCPYREAKREAHDTACVKDFERKESDDAAE
jgi:hypothetical protein